jgi:hypothetical protein
MGFDLQEMQQILAGCTEAAEIRLTASKSNVLFQCDGGADKGFIRRLGDSETMEGSGYDGG